MLLGRSGLGGGTATSFLHRPPPGSGGPDPPVRRSGPRGPRPLLVTSQVSTRSAGTLTGFGAPTDTRGPRHELTGSRAVDRGASAGPIPEMPPPGGWAATIGAGTGVTNRRPGRWTG